MAMLRRLACLMIAFNRLYSLGQRRRPPARAGLLADDGRQHGNWLRWCVASDLLGTALAVSAGDGICVAGDARGGTHTPVWRWKQRSGAYAVASIATCKPHARAGQGEAACPTKGLTGRAMPCQAMCLSALITQRHHSGAQPQLPWSMFV